MGAFDHIIERVSADESDKAAKREAEERAEQEKQHTKLRTALMDFLIRVGAPADTTTYIRHPDAFMWVARGDRGGEVKCSPSANVCAKIEGIEFVAAWLSHGSSFAPMIYATAQCDLCGSLVWSRMLNHEGMSSLTDYYQKQAEKEIAKIVTNPPHVWGVDLPSGHSEYTARGYLHSNTCGRIKWTLTDSRSGARLNLSAKTQEEAQQEAISRLGYTLNRGPT
jgi:hypothetical protein